MIAASCEYQLLRKLDEKLGRSPKAVFDDDEMLQHAAKLGDVHEHRVLDNFVDEFGHWDPAAGRGVYDVVPAPTMDRATLLAKHRESLDALRSGADVVFQAAFFDGQFHGRSDFLVRQADGSYAVFDTKLARHAKVTALLQLAAYGDQLLKAGITPAPAVTLVLGATVPLPGGGFDYVRSHHKLSEILPVFRERRDRFLALTASHLAQPGTVQWGAPGLSACGRCDYCQEQVAATDDLLLVARMSSAQRKALHGRNIFTVKELAEARLAGANRALLRLQDQARMQSGVGPADGEVRYVKDGEEHTIRFGVIPENTLAELPPPSDGDIFFDFEGDPLWQESATGVWGLEYLFGVIEAPAGPGVPGVFRPFWAHDREAEKQAFLDFLEYVQQRRQDYPDMHVYHYAAYEKTALRKLSVHARGRGGHRRRVAAGRAPGGSLPDRPEQHPDLRELLQHQETRAAVHGDEPALRGREGRRRLGGRLRPLLRRARRRPGRGSGRDPRRDFRLQRIRLPLHTGAPQLAPGPGPGTRHQAGRRRSGPRPRPHPRPRGTTADGGGGSVPGAADLDPLEVALAGAGGYRRRAVRG